MIIFISGTKKYLDTISLSDKDLILLFTVNLISVQFNVPSVESELTKKSELNHK